MDEPGRDSRTDLARERLEEARRIEALGRLVAGVAHELNNPLTAILTFAEQLRADATSTVDRVALETIHSQAVRSRAIVADLLAFVREDTARPYVPVLAASVAEAVSRALQPHLTLLEIGLVAEVRDDGAWVDADATALEQAVTNLLLNAAYAVRTGGTVTVRNESTPTHASLVVEDDGPGFDADVAARLFEPFYTAKPVGQGTGLGLFVAMGIARRHSGELLAENRADGARGARFTLRLPRIPAPGVRVSGEMIALPADQASAPPTILLVDDEEPIRASLRRYFTRRGWRVLEAPNAEEALTHLRGPDSEAIAVIVCDLRMPGIGGAGLHDALRNERPAMLRRLVLVSGDLVSMESTELLKATTCQVLEKPFDLKQLALLAEEMVAEQGRAVPAL